MQRGFTFDKSQLKTVCSTVSERKFHIINHLVLLIIQFDVPTVIKVQDQNHKIKLIFNQWIIFYKELFYSLLYIFSTLHFYK